MSSLLKLIILLIGISYTVTVMSMLVRKKINEKNTIVWLTGSILIFLLSAYPEGLDRVAKWVGVSYPPALLFLVSMLVLLLIVLYQSIQISSLNEKIKELSQNVALRNYRSNHNYNDSENEKVRELLSEGELK